MIYKEILKQDPNFKWVRERLGSIIKKLGVSLAFTWWVGVFLGQRVVEVLVVKRARIIQRAKEGYIYPQRVVKEIC